MTKYRKLELKYFTLQYPDYIEREKELRPQVVGKSFVSVARHSGKGIILDKTELLAFNHICIMNKIEMIEEAAKNAHITVGELLDLIKSKKSDSQLELFYSTLDRLLWCNF